MAKDIVFARDGALLQLDNGLPYRVFKGQAWAAEDPLVKRWPAHFVDTPDVFHSDGPPTTPDDAPVERAVAAPGQKRGYIRRTPQPESASSW